MNDSADLSAPTTPPRTRRNHDNNLQTAPISSRNHGAFPFNTMSLPSSPSTLPNKRKHHRRTPSEGVFYMSSDEDLSSGPDGASLTRMFKLYSASSIHSSPVQKCYLQLLSAPFLLSKGVLLLRRPLVTLRVPCSKTRLVRKSCRIHQSSDSFSPVFDVKRF